MKSTKTKQNKFPTGWDDARVQDVLDHYDSQNEEAALAEDEAAFKNPSQTIIEVPNALIPAVRELVAKHQD